MGKPETCVYCLGTGQMYYEDDYIDCPKCSPEYNSGLSIVSLDQTEDEDFDDLYNTELTYRRDMEACQDDEED